MIVEARLEGVLVQFVEQRIALRRVHPLDVVDAVGIDVERLAPGRGMGADQRVLDVRGLALLLLAAPGDLGAGAPADVFVHGLEAVDRSEEHTSELQSLMRISYSVF